MSKETKKVSVGAVVFTILFCVLLSCVSPEAVKTDIQGIRNDMGVLEKIVDQKADNTVVADQIGEVNNRIEQTTQIAEELSVWRKSIQAETINYSGAGAVVIGTSIMAVIFLGAGLLLVRAFMKRGNMLSMLTGAIKDVGKDSPDTVSKIKGELKKCVALGDYCEKDRKNLGHFARKRGTFVGQKKELEV
ncbi:hypothetical protein LCGC14_0142140 [marine sediment metagenome]|uniref:Uncharacterized protein n=1 Tax=marine sediment metagenome TaxID=412755 RepID=A0A0F9V4Q6_9ZZZZ